jgi:uncharacterized protein (TIGR02284 family)
MDHSKAISVLNGLIETCRDGEQGFRTALDGVSDAKARSLFLELADERARFARELQQEVGKLGGTPEDSGSMSGSVHRGWMNIKSLVTGKDEAAIVAEAERGEDVAKKAFEAAARVQMPPDALALVERMNAQVHAAHDRVRELERLVETRK